MKTNETVNGSAKSGDASKGAATSTDGKDVKLSFDTTEGATETLSSWLKGEEAKGAPGKVRSSKSEVRTEKGEVRNGKVLVHDGVEEEPDRPEDGEEGDSTTKDTKSTKGDGEEENAEAAEDAAEQETTEEGAEEEHEPSADPDSEVPKEWPKSAVSAIAEIRKERRELKERAETVETSLNEALSRLEAEELKRPVVVPNDPLSFASTPEKLDAWANVAERNLDLIEGFLDEALDKRGQRLLEEFARENGAWDETEEKPNPQALKAIRREMRDVITKAVPQKRAHFEQVKQFEAAVEKDPVLGLVWKNKASVEYRDAMGVLETVPEMRRLPHYKQAAAIFALGLREYRKLNPAAAGASANDQKPNTKNQTSAPAANGNGAKPKQVVKTVKGAGRATVLPRNPSPELAEEAQLRDRVRGADATTEDFVAMTRRQLLGKVRA